MANLLKAAVFENSMGFLLECRYRIIGLYLAIGYVNLVFTIELIIKFMETDYIKWNDQQVENET